jgi:hypothetical protein
MERRHFERLVEDVTAFTLRWSADTAVKRVRGDVPRRLVPHGQRRGRRRRVTAVLSARVPSCR